MKKRLLLFTLVVGLGYIALTSYKLGAARQGYDCTGAESAGIGTLANPTGCSVTGGGCHATSATTGISVVIELDSAGTATTHYKAGLSYTVKITGTNGTSHILPKYGFQITALKGTASAATESDGGTLSAAPTGTQISPVLSPYTQLTIGEQSSPISLGGGTTFTQMFTWTPPAVGTGSVSFWGAANFVNGNGNQDINDLWNTTNISIDEWPANVSVATVGNALTISSFPNPAATNLNLQMDNATPGIYNLHIFNMNGSAIASQNMEVNGANQTSNINTSNWTPGLYNIVIEKDGNRKTIMVVKQ